MTTTGELVEAICLLLERPGSPIPVTLMNHEVGLAREIIADVVERSAAKGIAITQAAIDPKFAAEMKLARGDQISANVPTTVVFEPGLDRQVMFRRATN
jgi:hypothetical protein